MGRERRETNKMGVQTGLLQGIELACEKLKTRAARLTDTILSYFSFMQNAMSLSCDLQILILLQVTVLNIFPRVVERIK